MAKVIEKTGKTVEEAKQAALEELGVSESDIEVKILENPTKKFFGLFGETPAKIRVTVKEKPAPTPPAPPVETFSAVEEPAEPEPEKISTPVEEEKIPEVAEKKSDFDKTPIIDKAKKFLSEVFAAMNVEAQIEVKETERDIIFDLSGKSLGVLIGKRGQTLDSLQYLTNLAANKRDSEERVHFVLDVENYRARRTETLQKLAKSVADRVRRMQQEVKLEPMNRHERRVIHTALQDNDRVETHSVGEEPYRYSIVSPKRRRR